ncbi:pseudouridine synthase [Anatilimnocola floriformis]|uniref:pseudouridine synthase n=1 Tax=Anatilimnocola floriformis TaxID=2948575 RepID=UPI0020C22E3D|nr:pseudouridine synthase [Anatilimnocola floriformis]
MTRQRRHKSSKSSGSSRAGQQSDAGRGESGSERLQKVLAAAGVASRRDCEELIREGRVEVDRKVVTELGTRVDPVAQEIRVDGEALKQPKRVYYALNKPMDVVCTNFDPSGRTRVIDLVPDNERVFAVGRLDRASEGLILLTNDGNFSNHITHPRYGVEKTYIVRVAGRPGPEELAKLRRGVHLAEGFCKVESVTVKSRHKQSADLLIVLDEGRNREIRRVLAKVGHKVIRLKRIAVGDLKLGALEEGEWRKLTQGEIDGLLAITRKKRKDKKKPPPREAEAAPQEEAAEEVRVARPKKVAPAKNAAAPAKSGATPAKIAADPTKPKPLTAKEIADRVLAGEDFEDMEDDFEELLNGEDEDGDLEEEDLGEDDDLDDDDFGDDDEDLIEQTYIREEIKDDGRPPRSGPAPRGDVLDFDEEGPPPLQSRKVREQRSSFKPPASKPQGPKSPAGRAPASRAPAGRGPAGRAPAAKGDRPLRAEPRTSHRRRGEEQTGVGQSFRRGQKHRMTHEERIEAGNRRAEERRSAEGRGGEGRGRGRDERGRDERDPRDSQTGKPRRPGKLVPNRPQEDRGARGKYPGKSFGKGKKFEGGGGGGRGAKTIFGKRIKKKGRG